MQNSMGHLPPPAVGEEPVLAGRLIPPMGAAETLAGGTTASGPGAWPGSLPGIP